MPASLTLEEFLRQERQAGAQDSSGKFSVDFELAFEKYREHQMSTPGFYLLKLLQAAAVLQAQNATLVFRRNDVKLTFELMEPGRFGELARVVESLHSLPKGRSALDHLVAALNGALVLGPALVEWSHHRGRRRETLICKNDGVELDRNISPAGPGADRSAFKFYLRRKPRSLFDFLLKTSGQRLTEYQQVLRRAGGLPISLSLDGRPLETQSGEASMVAVQLAPSRGIETGFWFRPPENACLFDHRGDRVGPRKGPVRCSCVLLAGKAPRLVWFRDGLLVDEDLDFSPDQPVEAWLSARQLKSDLSGFKLVRDRTYQTEFERIQEVAGWVGIRV